MRGLNSALTPRARTPIPPDRARHRCIPQIHRSSGVSMAVGFQSCGAARVPTHVGARWEAPEECQMIEEGGRIPSKPSRLENECTSTPTLRCATRTRSRILTEVKMAQERQAKEVASRAGRSHIRCKPTTVRTSMRCTNLSMGPCVTIVRNVEAMPRTHAVQRDAARLTCWLESRPARRVPRLSPYS